MRTLSLLAILFLVGNVSAQIPPPSGPPHWDNGSGVSVGSSALNDYYFGGQADFRGKPGMTYDFYLKMVADDYEGEYVTVASKTVAFGNATGPDGLVLKTINFSVNSTNNNFLPRPETLWGWQIIAVGYGTGSGGLSTGPIICYIDFK